MEKRKAIILINPSAGKCNYGDIVPVIEKRFKTAGWEYEISIPESKSEMESASRNSFGNGFGTIIAVGGDGTIHDIITGIDLKNQSLGIIPLGSGNDLFRMHRMDIDPFKALDNIINGEEWRIDIGIVNGKRFLNTAGIGIDSETLIVRRDTSGFIKRNYVLLFLKTLGRLKPVQMRITADGKRYDGEYMWVIACNNNYIGGGMLIGPNAVHDDGLLDLVMIGKMSKFRMIKNIPAIFKGTFVNQPEVKEVKASEILIETDTPCEMGVDGDLMATTPARITVLQKALRMITSRKI